MTEIEAIKARHEADVRFIAEVNGNDNKWITVDRLEDAHADRAFLLSALSAANARAEAAEKMLLVFMAAPPDFTVDQARAAIAALRPTALSEEERIEVTAERLRKAAQDWAREMVDKPPYWQALAAAIVPTNQEPRND